VGQEIKEKEERRRTCLNNLGILLYSHILASFDVLIPYSPFGEFELPFLLALDRNDPWAKQRRTS
jgi:hypothetical protein